MISPLLARPRRPEDLARPMRAEVTSRPDDLGGALCASGRRVCVHRAGGPCSLTIRRNGAKRVTCSRSPRDACTCGARFRACLSTPSAEPRVRARAIRGWWSSSDQNHVTAKQHITANDQNHVTAKHTKLATQQPPDSNVFPFRCLSWLQNLTTSPSPLHQLASEPHPGL